MIMYHKIKYPESTSLLIAYEAEAAPFPSTYFTELGKNWSPVAWWTALGKLLEPEEISKECLKFVSFLLSCPASSASIERIFFNFGVIHSKLRNHLGNDTAKKIGHVLSNIKRTN